MSTAAWERLVALLSSRFRSRGHNAFMTSDAGWVESMPEIYDRCLGPAVFVPWAARVAAATAALSPARVLELAAGTGILTAALVDAVRSAEIVATDLSPAMVSYAATRVPGATYAVADAQNLDYSDSAFDVVVCQFGVMFFPDKPAAYAEAARVLAPGGTFLFTVWDAVETSTLAAALVQSLAVVVPGDPPDFVVRIPHGYGDTTLIKSDLADGGLIATGIERLVPRGNTPSAREVARGFCYGTPLRFELEKRGALDALAAAVGEEMTARLGAGPVDGDLAGFLVTAQVA